MRIWVDAYKKLSISNQRLESSYYCSFENFLFFSVRFIRAYYKNIKLYIGNSL